MYEVKCGKPIKRVFKCDMCGENIEGQPYMFATVDQYDGYPRVCDLCPKCFEVVIKNQEGA